MQQNIDASMFSYSYTSLLLLFISTQSTFLKYSLVQPLANVSNASTVSHKKGFYRAVWNADAS